MRKAASLRHGVKDTQLVPVHHKASPSGCWIVAAPTYAPATLASGASSLNILLRIM
jgi:hypothetical protein